MQKIRRGGDKMEELLVKFEELLDTKFEAKFAELKQEIIGLKEEIQEVKQEVAGLKEEVQEVKQEIAELKEEVQEVKQEIAELKEEVQDIKYELENVKQNIADLKQEMLDRFLLFEYEYGDRILAIGDSTLMDNQKNVERAKRMHELEERMDAHEIKLAVCRNDIFKLQQKSNKSYCS